VTKAKSSAFLIVANLVIFCSPSYFLSHLPSFRPPLGNSLSLKMWVHEPSKVLSYQQRVKPCRSRPRLSTSPKYLHQCLKKIQSKFLQKRDMASSSSLAELEAFRHRMQQQQRNNHYLTDSGRVSPRMDGLYGMKHCGSLSDLEACLQTQVFRCQDPTEQGGEKGESFNKQRLKDQAVWPSSKQIVFRSDGTVQMRRTPRTLSD